MKKNLTLSVASGLAAAMFSTALSAQTRYLDEVFTDSEIVVTSNQAYGINFSAYAPGSIGGPQLVPLFMDVYMPDPAVDTSSSRPLVIYMHTGSFLPKGLASPMGEKTDSAAVEMCRRFAKAGYVAVSATYRLGWLANSTNLDLRRGTNLLAVYNAVQDIKACVRAHRGLALTSNPYEINADHIALVGQGSGGYITLAYASLSDMPEITTPNKFQYSAAGTGIFGNPVNAGDPYVDTAIVGDWNGYGGAVTLTGNTTPLGLPEIDLTATGRNYINTPGLPDNVTICLNMGGALGDSAWYEADETPVVSVHCRNDFFAPYYRGVVQVPVAGQFFPVVEVVGSHTAVKMAETNGNNAFFANANFNDPISQVARNNPFNLGQYGQLLTFNIPPVNPALPFQVNSNPWDWWDPTDPLSVNETNPNIKSQSIAYIDSVMGFMVPRIAYAFKQNGLNVPGLSSPEQSIDRNWSIYPNPAHSYFVMSTPGARIDRVEVMDLGGKVIRAQNGASSEVRVSVEGLKPGIYLVAVHTNQGKGVRRISVN